MPRSVVFRTEIGSTPRRDRSGSGSRSVVVQCGVVFGVGSCVSQAGQPWAGSDGARVCRGRLVLHTRAHSASAESAESCGTTPSVVGTVLLPCAQTTLTAHGSPTTTHNDHQKIASFQQKPVPAPQRPQSPMCSIDNNHAHQAPPRHRPTNPPQTRAGTQPISTRNSTDLEPEYDRSRRGTGPISARVTTDLDAARNRPQGGERGIRTPGAPGAQRFSRPPHSAALSSLHARTTTRTTRCSCGRPDTTTTAPKRNAVVHVDKPRARCVLVTLVWQRHCPCPRGQAASTASTESTASAAPTGVNRGRRTPACESVWPTPAPARRACPDVPPPRPAPSPATRADGA